MPKVACIFFPYFFVSLARAREPRLRGCPLVIYRGGQVVGVSPELVNLPLVGLPLAEARGCCPDARFLAYDDSLYKEAHRQYLQVLTAFSPLLEPLNEEECCFDLTGSDTGREMEKLRRDLPGKGWGPALVGIGQNKFLARLAARVLGKTAEATRDFRSFEVLPGKEEEFLAGIPLAMDWLLPAGALQRLASLGLKCFGDVRKLSLAALVKILGKDGYTLYQHSRGIDHTPLVNLYPPGKIAFGLNFDGGIASREALTGVLREGARVLASLLRTRKKGCRSITLQLIGEEQTRQVSRLVPWGCREEGRLYEILGILCDKVQAGGPVLGVIIEASALYDWKFAEQDLFSPVTGTSPAKLDLASITQALEDKFPGTVSLGIKMDRREQVLSFWDPWRFPGGAR